jgi:phosphoglycolate phosphatase
MLPFTHILFDLDGTLTNPRLGIGYSLKYALLRMQIDGFSEEKLDHFIGPPLQHGFKTLFGMNEKETDTAVGYFRSYYAEKGLYENETYEGTGNMLKELHQAGKQVYVVTSKLEKFAGLILAHFGFDLYIDGIQGAEATGEHSGKGLLISQLLTKERIRPSLQIAMAGDTHYDLTGAKENGISGIAVTYGFGSKESLKNCNPDYMVDSVEQLAELLLS